MTNSVKYKDLYIGGQIDGQPFGYEEPSQESLKEVIEKSALPQEKRDQLAREFDKFLSLANRQLA